MLHTFRARHIGLSLLLTAMSFVLFGCAQGLDVPMGTTESSDFELGIHSQGVKFDEELLGSERQAALEQALGDWKVQGVKSLLESEGKQLELDRAQAFSFERGSHEGQVVLLPFGDRLLSYWQFRERSHIMLTVHQPGATVQAINDSQERKETLEELQAHEVFQWLEEELGKRGRHPLPELTLLLVDHSQGEVIFFVFAQPEKAKPSEASGQIVKLDPGVEGDAGGSCIISCDTSSTVQLDPGTGLGGSSSFTINGISQAYSASGFNAINFWSWHATTSNKAAASVSVDGMLDPQGTYQPSGSFVLDCHADGIGSISCAISGFQVSWPQFGQIYKGCAKADHFGFYQGTPKGTKSGPNCATVVWLKQ